MVFFITTLLLIGYGINLLVSCSIAITSEDASKRRYAVLAIFTAIFAAAGVIYLAAH